jgi:dTDP-4-amino-4,6-dideoxygalactose transaminase
MWRHAGLGLPDPRLDDTERLCREVISLPMSAETTETDVDITVQVVREFFSSRHIA